MVTEVDVERPRGRRLRAYDTGDDGNTALAVVWHHGTPALGPPPPALLTAPAAARIRWITYDRPGYGASSPDGGRDIGAAADDVAAVLDLLGVERVAMMGHGAGGAHALACTALLPDRVVAAAVIAGRAPYDARDLDWFAGLEPLAADRLRSALFDRATRIDHGISGGLGGEGLGPVDDDLAAVAYWGFEPAEITAPTLLVHGGRDRSAPPAHADWLARTIPGAVLRLHEDRDHDTIWSEAGDAVGWIVSQAVAHER